MLNSTGNLWRNQNAKGMSEHFLDKVKNQLLQSGLTGDEQEVNC